MIMRANGMVTPIIMGNLLGPLDEDDWSVVMFEGSMFLLIVSFSVGGVVLLSIVVVLD